MGLYFNYRGWKNRRDVINFSRWKKKKGLDLTFPDGKKGLDFNFPHGKKGPDFNFPGWKNRREFLGRKKRIHIYFTALVAIP